MGIQDTVEAEARFWAKLWGSDMEYKLNEIEPPDNMKPPPIAADMIRKACRTFPSQTGLGPDSMQPRALLRLSDEALEALADI